MGVYQLSNGTSVPVGLYTCAGSDCVCDSWYALMSGLLSMDMHLSFWKHTQTSETRVNRDAALLVFMCELEHTDSVHIKPNS